MMTVVPGLCCTVLQLVWLGSRSRDYCLALTHARAMKHYCAKPSAQLPKHTELAH